MNKIRGTCILLPPPWPLALDMYKSFTVTKSIFCVSALGPSRDNLKGPGQENVQNERFKHRRIAHALCLGRRPPWEPDGQMCSQMANDFLHLFLDAYKHKNVEFECPSVY
jgi:hypothetical protein